VRAHGAHLCNGGRNWRWAALARHPRQNCPGWHTSLGLFLLLLLRQLVPLNRLLLQKNPSRHRNRSSKTSGGSHARSYQPHHLQQIEPAQGSDFFMLFKSNPLKSSEFTKLDILLDKCNIRLESGLPLGFYAAHDVSILRQKSNVSESAKAEFLEKE
jgi:hypothetical protein